MSQYIKKIQVNKNNSINEYYLQDPQIEKNIDDLNNVVFEGMPDANGYEYVDLGLPSGNLWATCNVGTDYSYSSGDKFAYGDIIPTSAALGWTDYKWCKSSQYALTKYNLNSTFGIVDGLSKLELIDDAARVRMGGDWQIPSIKDYQELFDYTTLSFESGYNCYKFTSKINGQIIRFYIEYYGGAYSGYRFQYWTSEINPTACYYGKVAYYSGGTANTRPYITDQYRYMNYSIRAVLHRGTKYYLKSDIDDKFNNIQNQISDLYNKEDKDTIYDDTELREKLDTVEDILFDKFIGEVGDVVLVNNDTLEKIAVKSDDLEQYKKSHFPIGIVVIPTSHNVYKTGEAAIISLKPMNYSTPQEGGTSEQDIRWGVCETDIVDLPNLDKVPYCGTSESQTNAVLGETAEAHLPSTNFSNAKCKHDETAYYNYNGPAEASPSPYLTDGTRNPMYYQTTSPASKNNCLADFDGRKNSDILLKTRGEKDYSSWKPDYDTLEDYQAVSCCDMYKTYGTEQGDWYLPSAGELGYLVARFKEINQAISKILQAYGNTYAVAVSSNYFWSSSEYSINGVRVVSTGNGNIDCYGKDKHCYVRAFTRLKFDEYPRPKNRLDDIIKRVNSLEQSITKEEMTEIFNSIYKQ